MRRPREPDGTPEWYLHLWRVEKKDWAFDELWKEIEPSLVKLLRSRWKSLREVDDVIQDTFTELARYPDRFDEGKEVRLLTWLSRIALNKAHDYHRRMPPDEIRQGGDTRDLFAAVGERAQPEVSDQPHPDHYLLASDASEFLEKDELYKALAACIARLNEPLREIIEGRHVDELTFEALGERHRIGWRRAHWLHTTALDKLKKCLKRKFGKELL